MKRQGNLIGAIAEIDNLHLAFTKAVRGKRDRKEVLQFQENLHEELRQLHFQLLAGNVRFGDYRFFTVYEPKKRDICAASFRERVVHHAIMNVLEPVFERFAIYHSYACRKGKGMHAAVQEAKKQSRKYECYLQLDIAKYFDSIDHEVALNIIKRLVKDKIVVQTFEKLFASYSTTNSNGMPIGNLISQHLANLYLGVFDHWVKESLKVRGYLRYMDDFILFGNPREGLRKLLDEVEVFLEKELKLRLHINRQLQPCRRGMSYLGYRIFPDGIRLMSKSKNRFVRKFKQYEENYLVGNWSDEQLTRHVDALIGFTSKADSIGFRRKVIENSRVLTEEKVAITV